MESFFELMVHTENNLAGSDCCVKLKTKEKDDGGKESCRKSSFIKQMNDREKPCFSPEEQL